MPRRSRDRCSWSIAATTRSSMRPKGVRDERHLSVVRDRVSRGPREGSAGRSARALRGVQQCVSGEPRDGRGGTRRRSSPPPGTRGSGGRRRPLAPAPGAGPAAAPPTRPPAPPAPPRAPGAPAGGAPGQRMTSPLRRVNPFMVQDRKQKARRLARALVSDLVVYHPEKRQQGLRDGTLPQLFKDEIEKSWQEYVEQVGQEVAKSTPFWAEALNEILAGGNKVF